MTLFNCKIKDLQLKGKIENQNATGMPILVIQGGPGISYDYLLNLAELLNNHPIVFYNPIAYDNKSDVVDESLLSFEHFSEEIDHIRKDLNLSDCIILSHSAGTVITLDYLLRHPTGVKASIFISPVFSVKFYQSFMEKLLSTFPEQVQTVIKQDIQGADVDPIDHMEAMAHFYQNHMCRLAQWPDALLNVSKDINLSMMNYLWGPNDFNVKGIWRDFERLEYLSQITIPTLLLSGEFDFITHQSCQFYANDLSQAVVAEIKNASHSPNYENPDALKSITEAFLKEFHLCAE